jgi:hypothetical protein
MLCRLSLGHKLGVCGGLQYKRGATGVIPHIMFGSDKIAYDALVSGAGSDALR